MATENFIARRSESADAESISSMVSRQTENIFGRTDVEMVIEYANLSITLVGVEKGEILAHMALMDYPALNSVDQDSWENWIHNNFKAPQKSTAINSLFMHLFVAKEGFAQAAAAELLRAVFMTIPLLQYVYLTTSPGQTLGNGLKSHMEGVVSLEVADEGGLQSEVVGGVRSGRPDLYVAHRHEHFPMLHVRTARVEDTDDLMPIFMQSSETGVNNQYGEFFLAELIESQDEHHKTIVADVNGVAVGFLSVTSVVDVEHLNTSYQLEPFHGLRKPHDKDEITTVSTTGSERSSLTTLASTGGSISMKPEATNNVTLPREPPGGASSAGEPEQASSVGSPSGLLELQNTPQTSLHETTQKTLSASSQASTSTGEADDTSSSKVLESGSGMVGESSPGSSAVKIDSKTSAGLAAASAVSDSHKSQSLLVPSDDSNIEGAQNSEDKTALSRDGTPVSQKSFTEATRPDDVDEKIAESSSTIGGEAAETVVVPPVAPVKKAHKKQYVFKGPASALAVQLFSIDEKYEMRSLDLLPMVFQLFPEHDYLVLSQPHSLPEFPLLTQFTRLLPRPGVVVPQDLYVLHKCGLLHNFSVRNVCSTDMESLSELVADVRGSEDLLQDTRRYLEAKRDPLDEGFTPLFVLVAECAHQLVGVCVLREEEDIRYIQTHYNIDYFVYFDYHPPSSHAHLHHFVLNPVFHSYTKFFLKECLRMSHTSCLYYPLYPGLQTEPRRPHSIITALTHMVPIKARSQIVYDIKDLDINCPLDDVVEQKPPYALYHTNRKLAYEPKIHINSRVVVVGASDTAISFLETFLFSPHLHFSNLTLLSPHSFPAPIPISDSHSTREHLVTSNSMNYSRDEYQRLGISTWVNTVTGKLVALDRPEQSVYVDCGDKTCVLYYDYLVLCMGTQYLPGPELGTGLSRQSNIFTMNGTHDRRYLTHWIKNNYLPNITGPIVLYGNNVDVFSMVQGVLSCGVSATEVVVACPGKCSICPVAKLNNILKVALHNCGVQLMEELALTHCQVTDGKLTSLTFSKQGGQNSVTVAAQALIYMDEKVIDPEAFKALNDACLVMDWRLVIDTDHHTNDPLILAAGPLTKFSRRYRAEQWSHTNFNSKEVGERLASTLLSKLDPTLAYYSGEEGSTTDISEDQQLLLPVYTQPKTTAALLPGGYHYLHIYTPVSTPSDDPGRFTTKPVTMSTQTSNGYMHLHLDQYGRVDELVAMSQNPLLEATNYLQLYHVHEKYLNNLVQRWQDGLIDDFYTYFKEPWACAIFHDRFADLVEEVNEHVQSTQLQEGNEETLHSFVERIVTEDNARSRVNQAEVSPLFNNSRLKEDIEKKLYKFLAYNTHHLPMYISPDYHSMKAR